MDRVIYLDHAATTPVSPTVVEAMLPYFTEKFGNPSTIYSLGDQSKQAVTACRDSAHRGGEHLLHRRRLRGGQLGH